MAVASSLYKRRPPPSCPPPRAAQEHDVLVKHGVRVRVVGDLRLAPAGVQAAAAAIEAATAHHTRADLLLCFSYT